MMAVCISPNWLRWQAIDFEQETISVEHTICEVSQAVSNQKIIGRDTVKQKSSNRTLPMTPNIKALLLEYRGKHRQQNEHTATDYLFTDDSGNVVQHRCQPGINFIRRNRNNVTPKEPQGRFDYLNDMLVSMEMHDMATMKKLMQGYCVQDYVVEQMFQPF